MSQQINFRICVFVSIFCVLFIPNVVLSNQAIVTSGGVSLGSYKAGFLYFITETAKLNPSKMRISHLAGASAGGINSLLAIHSLCSLQKKSTEKKQSLFWRSWTENGINEIFSPEEVSSRNIFHRKSFDRLYDEIVQDFQRGLPLDCQMTLALPVTSEVPFNQYKDARVFIPALRRYIVIEIQGQGAGKVPRFSNLVLNQATNSQVLLPFGHDFESDMALVKKAILATSAFPIAFKPVSIPTCDQSSVSCPMDQAKEDSFYDGGVFDNAPLGLAAAVTRKRFTKKEQDKQQYIYVNSSNNAFSLIEGDQGRLAQKPETLSDVMTDYLANLSIASRNNQESQLVQNHPEVLNQTQVSRTTLPPTSGPLFAFLGFYDQSFREFDFEMGMSDARFFLQRYHANSDLQIPDLTDPAMETCLNAVRKTSDESPIEQCRQALPRLNDQFQILLQLSIFRAYHFCHQNDERPLTDVKYSAQCAFYKNLKSPPNLIDSGNFKDLWPLQNQNGRPENEIRYTFRVLDHYRFKYKDLNLHYSQLSSGLDKLYESQRNIFDHFRSKQPLGEGALIGVVQSKILSSIDDAPPRNLLYANIGSALEVGYNASHRYLPKPISIQTSLLAFDYESILGSQPDNLALLPNLGFVIAPVAFNGKNYRISLGLNLGYQFSTRDDLGNKTCRSEDYDVQPTLCSTAAAIWNINLGLFDRINLKFGEAIYDKKNLKTSPATGFLMVGYQFY